MKDHSQIEHINKYIEERMKHCYDAGYEQGYKDAKQVNDIMEYNYPLWKCEHCGKLIPYMSVFCADCTYKLLGHPPEPVECKRCK